MEELHQAAAPDQARYTAAAIALGSTCAIPNNFGQTFSSIVHTLWKAQTQLKAQIWVNICIGARWHTVRLHLAHQSARPSGEREPLNCQHLLEIEANCVLQEPR